MASRTRYHKFRFMSRSKPDLVMGERVILEAPLPPMTRGPHAEWVDHTTVHGFVRHVEQQIMQLYQRFGADCADFELKLDQGLPIAIYFSRPMDELELLEIREWRKRMQAQREPTHNPKSAEAPETELHTLGS
ncbi:hypothetical protein D3C71_79210 [compost metagenome]